MLLAALIAKYWEKHLNDADRDMYNPARGSFFRKLKWRVLYSYLCLVARLYGYPNAYNMAFIGRCMTYFD